VHRVPRAGPLPRKPGARAVPTGALQNVARPLPEASERNLEKISRALAVITIPGAVAILCWFSVKWRASVPG